MQSSKDVRAGGSGLLVSGGYFEVLGVKPVLGRLIGPQDEPGLDESPVVVLSYDYWQSRLGADPGVIGTTRYLPARKASQVAPMEALRHE